MIFAYIYKDQVMALTGWEIFLVVMIAIIIIAAVVAVIVVIIISSKNDKSNNPDPDTITLNIADFGGKADGKTDNKLALEAAWNKAITYQNTDKKVIIKFGGSSNESVYILSQNSLHGGKNVTILLDKNVTIMLPKYTDEIGNNAWMVLES